MELSKEKLAELGFSYETPEKIFATAYMRSAEKPDWQIMVDMVYMPYPNENKLAYQVGAWKSGEDSGAIVKRCQAGYITTVEELQAIIDICCIPVKLLC